MDVDRSLDPEIAPMVAELRSAFAPLTRDSLMSMRARLAAHGGEASDDACREDHRIQSEDGHEFAVRVYSPAGEASGRAAIVWAHGGGLVAGSHLRDDARFGEWCDRLGVVVLSVDYGLAPERPYPGALMDCFAALRWLADNSSRWGVDRQSIGVGGASAGGGLAAAVALRARDQHRPVAFQLLIYPMLDDRMVTASSQWAVPVWPPGSNEFGWNSYLAGRRGDDDVPPYAAPARATELTGLPPTFIGVGTLDGFLDEDVEYARRLIHSGVPTDLHVYSGAPHGFDAYFRDSRVAKRAQRDIYEWLAARVP